MVRSPPYCCSEGRRIAKLFDQLGRPYGAKRANLIAAFRNSRCKTRESLEFGAMLAIVTQKAVPLGRRARLMKEQADSRGSAQSHRICLTRSHVAGGDRPIGPA